VRSAGLVVFQIRGFSWQNRRSRNAAEALRYDLRGVGIPACRDGILAGIQRS
jgi:hypothetical protein